METRVAIGLRDTASSLRLAAHERQLNDYPKGGKYSYLPKCLRTSRSGHIRTSNSHHMTQTRPKAIGSMSAEKGANAALPRLPSQRPTRRGRRETKYERSIIQGSRLRAKKPSELRTSAMGARYALVCQVAQADENNAYRLLPPTATNPTSGLRQCRPPSTPPQCHTGRPIARCLPTSPRSARFHRPSIRPMSRWSACAHRGVQTRCKVRTHGYARGFA